MSDVADACCVASVACPCRLKLLHIRPVNHAEVFPNWFPVIRRDCDSNSDIRRQIAPLKRPPSRTSYDNIEMMLKLIVD